MILVGFPSFVFTTVPSHHIFTFTPPLVFILYPIPVSWAFTSSFHLHIGYPPTPFDGLQIGITSIISSFLKSSTYSYISGFWH